MSRRVVLAVVLLAAMLGASSAQAQIFRAYLASGGSDANPCTLQQPCRLLPAALSAVASGGEIWMLDSANFNSATVTVNKAVSILAVPGAVGSVVALNGPALIVGGGVKVALRNVVVTPLVGGGGTDGIQVTGGAHLQLEESVIANHSGSGVAVLFGKAVIFGTTLRNNTAWGVRVEGGSQGEISRSNLVGNGAGGFFVTCSGFALSRGLVSDSVISEGAVGVRASQSGLDGTARVDVVRTVIQAVSGAAVQTDIGGNGDAAITLNGATITHNGFAYVAGIGSIRTHGNNQFSYNGPADGTLVAVPLQ